MRSIQGLGIYTIIRDSIFSVRYWLVAAFLFWRKPHDRLALLAAFSLGISASTRCRNVSVTWVAGFRSRALQGMEPTCSPRFPLASWMAMIWMIFRVCEESVLPTFSPVEGRCVLAVDNGGAICAPSRRSTPAPPQSLDPAVKGSSYRPSLNRVQQVRSRFLTGV